MIASPGSNRFRLGQPINDYRSRLRAAIKANSATGAAIAGVPGWVHAIGAQFWSELEAFRRAAVDAQPASFALFELDGDVAACLAQRLISPQSQVLFDIAAT
jgi:hypothetical protein